MTLRTKAVVKDVKIADIRVGDKLLQDVIGHNDRALLLQGTFISAREITFLRKQLAAKIPLYSPQRYVLNRKTPGGIYDQDGKCLVRAGQAVTAAALEPLLDEGFEEAPTEDGGIMFFRKNTWPKSKPWHINDFNPLVRVETTTYINDEDREVSDPRGAHVRVGGDAAQTAMSSSQGAKDSKGVATDKKEKTAA